MPRKGSAWPITTEWRTVVLARIAELGISQNELARRAHVSKAALSQALNEDSRQTTVMPELHRALGLPPPVGPLLSQDDDELLRLGRSLTREDRAKMVERGQVLLEQRKRSRS